MIVDDSLDAGRVNISVLLQVVELRSPRYSVTFQGHEVSLLDLRIFFLVFCYFFTSEFLILTVNIEKSVTYPVCEGSELPYM